VSIDCSQQPEDDLGLEEVKAIRVMPGPPWFWYFLSGEIPSTWQKSSWGNLTIQLPSPANLRSKRSTTSAFWSLKRPMSVLVTGSPNAARIFEHSHSFSTDV